MKKKMKDGRKERREDKKGKGKNRREEIKESK